jgi:hypothetical protein
VVEDLEKLRNEEFRKLYSSPDVFRAMKSRRKRWPGHVARMGELRNAYKILAGKPEGKRPLGKPRSRWNDNIRLYLGEKLWLRLRTAGGLM